MPTTPIAEARLATTASATDPGSAGVNLIGGHWIAGRGPQTRKIWNPADTRDLVAAVQEASSEQVEEACTAAARAFPAWQVTPPPDRTRVLFRYRELLEEHFDAIAELIVRENGKLLSEARGSLRRGVDIVEFACGIPTLLMGRTLPDISRNVDSYSVLEPVGVVAGIPPFNFPAMIPLWMMPLAVACGNAFILKPAEKAPLTGTRLVELFHEAGLPDGVVGVVQGGKDVSERLITHPLVQAVSFVGSSAVAESVYHTASANGKRVQALGGAKNHLLVMPDADLPRSVPALIGAVLRLCRPALPGRQRPGGRRRPRAAKRRGGRLRRCRPVAASRRRHGPRDRNGSRRQRGAALPHPRRHRARRA